jgi:hypothetical protein
MDENLSEYNQYQKRMEEKYPKMLSGNYGGFAVGKGWWIILDKLMGQIQHHIDWKNRESEVVPQVVIEQIKEKFGGLRFYYQGGDDYISGMVTMAETWAGSLCEDCGAIGERRSGGWVRTLCDKHEAEYQARKRNV